jgi:phosphatidylserine decarboxylase
VLAPRAVRWLGPVAALWIGSVVAAALLRGAGRFGAAGLSTVLAGLLVFLLIFFRDPEREPGEGIVSAADGRVLAVESAGDRWLVSVFLGVLDVHVNRFPLDATVESVDSSGEGFRPAYRAEAVRNVQRRYHLRTEIGPVDVVQVTGIVARRLVSFVGPGAAARKADRLGMIVLGSRTDVLFPADRASPTVRVGDRVRAGSSTIGRISP